MLTLFYRFNKPDPSCFFCTSPDIEVTESFSVYDDAEAEAEIKRIKQILGSSFISAWLESGTTTTLKSWGK